MIKKNIKIVAVVLMLVTLFFGVMITTSVYAETEMNLLENPGFEAGGLLPFEARGSSCVISDDNPHSGEYCAFVSERWQIWTGIQYNIKDIIEEEGVYRATAWIRLADNVPEGTDSNFYLQAEISEEGYNSSYPIISNEIAIKGEWIKLSGLLSIKDYDYPLDKALLYICSSDTNLNSFYVDDFEFVKVDEYISENPPITEFPTEPNPVSKSTAEVDFSDEQQIIEGFGASGAFGSAQGIKGLPTEKRNRVLELLFDKEKGIGLSVLRNMLTPAIGAEEGKIDISYDSAQHWLMEQTLKYDTQIMTTCWTPPAWMKDNKSTIGGSLAKEHYDDFAIYLAGYIEAYKEQGIDIDIISPANEPDYAPKYDSCTWTPGQLAVFIKDYLKPELNRRSLDTKIMAAEEMRYRETWIEEILNDSEALEATDIIGVHGYDTIDFNPLTNALSSGKNVWMTEIMGYNTYDISMTDGMLWAKRIHQAIAQGGVSEWNFWYLANPYDGGNSSLIEICNHNSDYIIPKRFYTVGNYSKFIRPMAKRVNSTLIPNSDVYFSAYKNADGSEVMVAANGNVNEQTLKIELRNSAAKFFVAYRTSETEELHETEAVKLAEDNSVTITLPPMSVTTYIAQPLKENEFFRHTFALQDDIVLYEPYSGIGELTLNSGSVLGQFESSWDSNNGIRIDVTEYVQKNNGAKFKASIDMKRDNYYNTDAYLFFEIMHQDGSSERIRLCSKQGAENEAETFTGTSQLVLLSEDRVYLCMTHPTGYQLYDNVSLALEEQYTYSKQYAIYNYCAGKALIEAPEQNTATVIFAEYDKDQTLVKINTENILMKKGLNEIEANDIIGKNVKVMIWDDINSMAPKCVVLKN